MSEYISVDCTGTFLKNAGIVGLIRFLEHNHAVEGIDYILDGQYLRISVEYLRSHDIAQMYVSTISDFFEANSKFTDLIKGYPTVKESVLSVNAIEDKNIQKYIDRYVSAFSDIAPTTIECLKAYDATFDVASIAKQSKKHMKSKDYAAFFESCDKIVSLFHQNAFRRILIFKEILFKADANKNPCGLNMFFGVGNGGISFFNSKNYSLKVEGLIENDFINPLFQVPTSKSRKEPERCIECFEKSYFSKNNSFMVDTADDLRRKWSYYWNLEPDAHLCPVCAFLYLFVPLGFAFLGRTAVFVNQNASVEAMYRMMETYRSKLNHGEDERYYQRLYKLFTDEKLQMLSEGMSNIQVVFRDTTSDHYNMKIISKDIIQKLKEANKSGGLSKIEKVYLVFGDGKDKKYESIYQDVFDCILSHRSLYGLIDKCLRYQFTKEADGKGKHYWYLYPILKTEIICNGGEPMEKEKLMKHVNWAFRTGIELQKELTSRNETDNSVRGFVYRLINLSSVGDVAQFMDTVLRMYAGHGLAIPAVFKGCYESEEAFQAIAHSFILGLKNDNSDNTKGENNNE